MTIVKQDLDYFANNVINKNIEGLTRRGKYLYFTLSNGYIIAHFGMTGAFFVVKDIAEITNKNYYNHRHMFKPFIDLAPEPFSQTAKCYFLEKLKLPKYKDQPIKALLLEGNVFCGCGNIYDCEVLYHQKIHPLTKASELTKKQKEKYS